MNGVSAYLMKVVCAAVVCALVGIVGGEGTGSRLRKMTAGIFLALTVLSSLVDLKLPKFDTGKLHADAQTAVSDGTEQARQAQNAIITESVEAYIWNKAMELGLDVQARVTLDEQGLPRSVELTGNASPLERERLGESITRELGLGREAQTWIDPYQSSE